MKRSILAILFSLALILAPCSPLTYALDEAATLRLDNYHGGALDLSADTPHKRELLLAGDNTIDTTGEYGLRLDISRFNIMNDYTAGDHSSLTINVNSSTAVANGILTTGLLYLGADITLTINVSSTLAPTETSTSTVTGITTPLTKEISATARTYLTINNPTGNFGIYTGHFGAAQFNTETGNYGYQPFLTITHKITDGYGDAFFYNDFEGHQMSPTPSIVVTQPDYTFTHDRTATLGTFHFLPAVNGVSANFATALLAGADFSSENAAIVGSLTKELHPENYTTLVCIYGPTLCPFSPELFDLDLAKSKIVLADDLTTGAYHENTSPNITVGEPYALKIAFKTTRPDFVFSKLDGVGPASRALLNGIDVYGYIDARHSERAYVSPEEIYILAPLTVFELDEDEEEIPEEPQPEPEITILPKAPNTGVL